MDYGAGCLSARLSLSVPQNAFQGPQEYQLVHLLQREMGSERLLWMFLLGPAECVAIRKEDKRTKRKSATQMFLFAVTLLKQPRAPFSLSK